MMVSTPSTRFRMYSLWELVVPRPNRQSGARYFPEKTPHVQIGCVNRGRRGNKGETLGGHGDLLVGDSQAPLRAIVRVGGTKSRGRALKSSPTEWRSPFHSSHRAADAHPSIRIWAVVEPRDPPSRRSLGLRRNARFGAGSGKSSAALEGTLPAQLRHTWCHQQRPLDVTPAVGFAQRAAIPDGVASGSKRPEAAIPDRDV